MLTLCNPMFNYVYILIMVTSFFLDFTVNFNNFIALEDFIALEQVSVYSHFLMMFITLAQ